MSYIVGRVEWYLPSNITLLGWSIRKTH